MQRGKYPPLATDAEVNNVFTMYLKSENIEHKTMMIFDSFIAANDYNFGEQMTELLSLFLADNESVLRHCLALAETFLQKEL